MGRVLPAFTQFFDSEGGPLADGWVKFLESSSNNTLKNTYYDYRYQIVNANPLRLSADGRCPDVFGQGSYRVIVYKNDPDDETTPGEQVEVKDPVTAQSEDLGGGGGEGFQDWDSVTTYALGDIVVYNNEYYRSLIASNLNNNPALDTFAWEKVEFIEIWNPTISYNEGDLVRYEENLFFSKVALNLNNQPDESPVQWRRIDTETVGVNAITTTPYTVLVSERDYLLVYGNTSTADGTFTLPVVDASLSQFRVWICNASDYNLTIEPGLGANLWFDSTNNITIQKGSHLELKYCSNQNRWMPMNNNGPPLGGQNIGTSTLPVINLYVTDINLSGNMYLGDDQHIYLGDTNNIDIVYTSATSTLDFISDSNVELDVTGTLTLGATGDIELDSDTDILLLPGGANNVYFTNDLLPTASSYDIGSVSTRIDTLYSQYVNTSNDMTCGGAFHLVGISNNTDIFMFGSSPSDFILRNNDGSLNFYANGTNSSVNFYTNATKRWDIRPAGHILPEIDDTYDIGSSAYSARGIYSGYIYTSIISSLTGTIGISSTTNINIGTSSINRWTWETGGTFRPAIDSTYDIGTNTIRPANIYTDNIVSSDGDFSSLSVSSFGSLESSNITTGTQTYLFMTIDGNQSRISSPVESGSILYIDVLFNGTTYRFTGNSVP